ncbi:MAG: HAMP domain-containing histidine kinase [Bacteroidales bacterium]|nr:HAMP domain-containing histidine kinase [Bacteroidales bacterium]
MNNSNLEKLKTENTKLKQEQKQLIEQLNKLNQKLEESDAFKSHFLSNITNEIINPFTSILGISKNIYELNDSQITQIHAMSKLIYSEAFDLDFQLRNIFAAATIESGENNLELVNLKIKDFLEEIIENLRLKAEKNALYFEFTHFFSSDFFVTDAEKLRRILINLIVNAITFSSKKNKIRIHAELNKNGFLFRINNQGKPISKKDANVIFDRFKKLDTSINSLNQGHGLGLAIVNDYIELLNGNLHFESNKEDGTTFSISLPILKTEEQNFYMEDEDLFTSDDTELF